MFTRVLWQQNIWNIDCVNGWRNKLIRTDHEHKMYLGIEFTLPRDVTHTSGGIPQNLEGVFLKVLVHSGILLSKITTVCFAKQCRTAVGKPSLWGTTLFHFRQLFTCFIIFPFVPPTGSVRPLNTARELGFTIYVWVEVWVIWADPLAHRISREVESPRLNLWKRK